VLGGEVQAQVATRVLRDLDKDMRKAIAKDSRGIGEDLVAAIRAHPGVAPYTAVYAKLGRSARVRTRAGRPPEVVVGGAKRFSGGATINQLARPYEFGSLTGDTKKGKGEFRLSQEQLAGRARRHRRKRPFPQFPPKSNEGLWVNAVCEQWENRGTLIEEWLTIVDSVLAGVASKDHG
jgi:hypothetical protein